LVIKVGDTLETAKVVNQKPTIDRLRKEINPPQCLDFVMLSRNRQTGEAETVMAVDDTGMLDNLPINELASLLSGRRIHGDAAICRDEDFA
jgi:hypothetical protein